MSIKGLQNNINASANNKIMKDIDRNKCNIDALLLDFGGVLAEEGFRNGLRAIAEKNNLDADSFEKTGFEVVHKSGFVLGQTDEDSFWHALKLKTGILGDNNELKHEILIRFRLRSWMVSLLPSLKDMGLILGILSDQTHWLDELNKQDDFYKWFDHIFNSYYLGKSKRDPTLFEDIVLKLNIPAENILFVDDHPGNVERAKEKGYQICLYTDRRGFIEVLGQFCPGIHEMMIQKL